MVRIAHVRHNVMAPDNIHRHNLVSYHILTLGAYSKGIILYSNTDVFTRFYSRARKPVNCKYAVVEGENRECLSAVQS